VEPTVCFSGSAAFSQFRIVLGQTTGLEPGFLDVGPEAKQGIVVAA
jgi:hypothetical protein